MKPKVYLAGGLRSNWQDKVISECGDDFIFFNPREHGIEKESRLYTTWDLHHVKLADILFAYMEASNPSGYGLALEVGYAKALGKTIILIDEKSSTSESFGRYFQIVRDSADVVLTNFEDGLSFLKRFLIDNSLSII